MEMEFYCGIGFIILGLLCFRFPMLIAGYNTMTKEQKKKVDIKWVKKILCWFFILLGLLTIILSLFTDYSNAIWWILPISTIVLIIVVNINGNIKEEE